MGGREDSSLLKGDLILPLLPPPLLHPPPLAGEGEGRLHLVPALPTAGHTPGGEGGGQHHVTVAAGRGPGVGGGGSLRTGMGVAVAAGPRDNLGGTGAVPLVAGEFDFLFSSQNNE